MSLINKEVSDFSVQAFQNNEFKTVTKLICRENGVYSFSILRILLLSALPN